MKVFLDVGAHTGSTLHAVRDPKYAFDRIYCFEPASSCWAALESVADDRVKVCRFGLWNRTCEHALHGAGSVAATVFQEKFRAALTTEETARFVRATNWFEDNLDERDDVFLKLNCEGAEVDIVEDLLESGQLARVRAVMIDPDVRKIPSHAHREQELRARLTESGLANYSMADDVMVGGTHRARIQNWLRTVGAERSSLGVRTRQLLYVASEAARGRRGPLRAALTR